MVWGRQALSDHKLLRKMLAFKSVKLPISVLGYTECSELNKSCADMPISSVCK